MTRGRGPWLLALGVLLTAGLVQWQTAYGWRQEQLRTVRVFPTATPTPTATSTTTPTPTSTAPTPTPTATTSCGGYSYGGYCYYIASAASVSCDTVCSGHGSCDLTGTDTANPDATCNTIIDAMVGSDLTKASTISGGVACGRSNWVSTNWYNNSDTTTCAATNASVKRLCACTL